MFRRAISWKVTGYLSADEAAPSRTAFLTMSNQYAAGTVVEETVKSPTVTVARTARGH
jgi:hypothetical protein